MTILIERQSNEAAGYSRIVCDACEQPITDFTNAVAYYAEPVDDDAVLLAEAMHVHKQSTCRAKTCQQLDRDEFALLAVEEELGDHLVLLAARSGMSPATYAEIYEELRQRDVITEIDH